MYPNMIFVEKLVLVNLGSNKICRSGRGLNLGFVRTPLPGLSWNSGHPCYVGQMVNLSCMWILKGWEVFNWRESMQFL